MSDTIITEVWRYSQTGEALIQREEKRAVSLGILPKVHHPLEIRINDGTNTGDVVLENTQSITVTPTRPSLITTNHTDINRPISLLHWGSKTLLVPEELRIGKRRTIRLQPTSSNAARGFLLADRTPENISDALERYDPNLASSHTDTGSKEAMVDGTPLDVLIDRLDAIPVRDTTGDNEATGGPKSTCPCCGTRTPAGRSLCNPCQQAGCNSYERYCRVT
jgi:hypothetical protein